MAPIPIIIHTLLLLSLLPTTFSFQYINSLTSYQMCYISLNLSPFIDKNLIIGTDFIITLEMSTASAPESYSPFNIPDMYNQTLNTKLQLEHNATWRLFNMFQETMNYRLTIKVIKDSPQLFQTSIDSLYERRIYLKVINKTSGFFASILSDDLSSGIILPFNMVRPNRPSILTSSLFSDKLAHVDYQMPPFMPTYWNQNDVGSIILPWIPFMSRCSSYDQYIFIDQLLNSADCLSQITQNNLKIEKQIPYFNNWEKKSRCEINLNCILQEWNTSSGENPWWQSSKNVLFYIYPTLVDGVKFSSMAKDEKSIDNLIDDFKSELIPVYFIPDSISVKLTPDKIKLTLEYYIKDNKLTIGSAKIETISSDQTNSFAELTIVLEPKTLMNGFNGYYLQYWAYLLIFVSVAIMYTFFLIVIGQIVVKKNFKQIIVKSVELMLTPLLKGLGLSIVISFGFIMVFFIFAKINKISFIVTSFDGYITNKSRAIVVENGRTGLCLFFTGVSLLYQFISQLYKIPTQIQSKIMATEKRKKSVLAVKGTGKQFKIHQQTQQIQEIINHTSSIMNSKKHYTFMSLFLLNIIIVYQIELLINLRNIYFAIVIPFVGAFFKMVYKYFLIKDLLITSIAEGSQACLIGFVLIKCPDVSTLIVFYFVYDIYCTLVGWSVASAELKVKYFFTLPKDISLKQRIRSAVFYDKTKEINQRDNYANYLMQYLINNNVVFIRSIFFFLVYLSQDESNINTNGMIQEKFVIIQLFFSFSLVMAGLINNIFSMSLFPPIDYLQMLEYGLYRFKTRLIRWGHDKFDEVYTQPYYKNVYNMGYSSQMYFYTSSIMFSLIAIWWGAYIIMRNYYAVFSDPAFMVILIIVVTIYKVCSFLCAIVSSKLKLYNVKTEKTNIALDVIQLFLKKKDLLKYEDLEVVKEYFIKKNSQWIANNFFKIFTKGDFLRDNEFLLNKYRFYLNIQREKNMEAKKKETQLESVTKENDTKVISIERRTLEKVVKPLVSRWLSLARQHLFLQKIIVQSQIREIKKLQHCQYCKINIYTGILEKYPLYTLANKFRIQNAGKPFSSKAFINFYARTQEFKTTCLECRERAKSEKNLGNYQRAQKLSKALVLKWLFLSRSTLLHNEVNKNKKANQLNKLVPKSKTPVLQSLKSIKSIKSIRQFLEQK